MDYRLAYSRALRVAAGEKWQRKPEDRCPEMWGLPSGCAETTPLAPTIAIIVLTIATNQWGWGASEAKRVQP